MLRCYSFSSSSRLTPRPARRLFRAWTAQLIQNSFTHLAENVGKNAWVVRGHDHEADRFFEEVGETYLGPHWFEYDRLIPALLLTDKHPEQVDETSVRLVIPVKGAEERFGGWGRLMNLIIRFITNGDQRLIQDFERVDALETISRVVEAKPGLFGFKIDFVALVRAAKAKGDETPECPMHRRLIDPAMLW